MQMNLFKIPAVAAVLLCLCIHSAHAQGVKGQDGTGPARHYTVSSNFLWRGNVTTKAGATGFKKCPVILAEYSDAKFSSTVTQFDNMLNKVGYDIGNAKDCAASYFNDQFGFRPTFDVIGIATLPEQRSYYGKNSSVTGNDIRPGTMVAQACQAVDAMVDFSQYDEDGDGYVDRVFVFYAGEDESQQLIKGGKRENSEYVWSHSNTLQNSDYGKPLILDGVMVNLYACSSELYRVYESGTDFTDKSAPIGTFCHEMMHTFGMPDLYDTDYEMSGGIAGAMWGTTSIMDSGGGNSAGNYPPNLNAVERERLSLMEPEDLKPGNYIQYPVNSKEGKIYRIVNPEDPTDYFLIEYREDTGWDKYIGGKGMLVYHIDKSDLRPMHSDIYGKALIPSERWNNYNEVNCRPGVLTPDGKAEQTVESHQCADLIEADGRVDVNPTPGSKSDISGIFFPQNGATGFGATTDRKIKFWNDSLPTLCVTNITLIDGAVSFKVKDITCPVPPDPTEPPATEDALYIIIWYSEAPDDDYYVKKGTVLDMKVSNSVNASGVDWFFDGSPIADPKNFTIDRSGEIRADIKWPDGTVDNLHKKIKVR